MYSPQFHQRGLIISVIDLQMDTVSILDYRPHGAVNDAARVQRDGDAVTDLELMIAVWRFAGGHGRELYV
jgi:hypothetical protein